MTATLYETLKRCIREQELVAVATVLSGEQLGKKILVWQDGRTISNLSDSELQTAVIRAVQEHFVSLESGRTALHYVSSEIDLFIDVYTPLPRLFVIGAAHIAIPLVSLAKIIGFHTIVIDSRRSFATRDRFPHADELTVDWPAKVLEEKRLDPSSYVAIVSHDDKMDNPALKVALESPARYIGALGSSRTHTKRVEALKEMGLNESQIARIRAPIGVRLGARTTEEIALAIITEIVAASHGIQLHPDSKSS